MPFFFPEHIHIDIRFPALDRAITFLQDLEKANQAGVQSAIDAATAKLKTADDALATAEIPTT